MSRFSKKEAEARGWVFVHKSPERIEANSGDPQGRSLRIAPSVRAEKYVSLPGRNATLINEEAETMGLLLERIHAYEQHLERTRITKEPAPVDESVEPREVELSDLEDDQHFTRGDRAAHSVLTPSGSMTEAEWSKRDSADSIFDGDKMVFFEGSEPALGANRERQEIAAKQEEEDRPLSDVGPVRQLVVDNHDSVDSPGQGAPSLLVVRDGEESIADVSLRKDAEEVDQENARVLAEHEEKQARKRAEEAHVPPQDVDEQKEADKQSDEK